MKTILEICFVCVCCCVACTQKSVSPSDHRNDVLALDTGDGTPAEVSALISCAFLERATSINHVERSLLADATFVDRFGAYVNCDSVTVNGVALVNDWTGTVTAGRYSSANLALDPLRQSATRILVFNYLGNVLDLPFTMAPRFDLQPQHIFDTVSIAHGLSLSYSTIVPNAKVDVSLMYDPVTTEELMGDAGKEGQGWVAQMEPDDGTLEIPSEVLAACTPYGVYELRLSRSSTSIRAQGDLKVGMVSSYTHISFVYLIP